jgi:hypothetical protein
VETRRTRVPYLFVILGGLLLAAALLLTPARPAAATEPTAGDRIVEVAMQSLGQHGGQCFPWVRQVVHVATGIAMGNDYHHGYLEGGAHQLGSLGEVRRGDVIQIVDPNNTAWDADYPGLHTAIVIEQNGDGTVTVIDSNANWDEMVRIRTDYDPAASAARFPGLEARAYRFTQVASPVESSQAALTAGEQARVTTDTGGCLNLRSGPSTGASIIHCLPNGTTLTVLDGEIEGGDFRWRLVDTSWGTGWVADQFLVPLGSSAPPPTSSSPEPASSSPEPASSGGTAQISGSLPVGGGVALVMWSGGPVTSVRTAAEHGGCNALSIWITAGGHMLGYIANAPDFVNQGWFAQYPGDLPAQQPLLIVCSQPGASTAPPSSSTPTTPTSSGGSTSGPTSGDGPPGPAGN